MCYTRKLFKRQAEVLKNARLQGWITDHTAWWLADSYALEYKHHNPRFDRSRFFDAIGIPDSKPGKVGAL